MAGVSSWRAVDANQLVGEHRTAGQCLIDSTSQSGCIILCLGVSWALFELASITCNAVFAGLVNDVVPRSVIGRFFGMFRAVSLIAGMMFHYKLLGVAQDHYVAIFLGIGALCGVPLAGVTAAGAPVELLNENCAGDSSTPCGTFLDFRAASAAAKICP